MLLSVKLSIALSLLNSLFISSICAEFKVYCDPVWVSAANGDFPDNSIDYGSEELIVRIKAGNDYMAGFLSPVDKKAYIPYGAIEFTDYEVLTNPNKCSLDWVQVEAEGEDSEFPEPGIDLGGGKIIGRGVHEGYIIAGTATEDGVLDVVFEGTIQKADSVEILTSSYPKMAVKLSDFTFEGHMDQGKLDNAKYQLFAVEVIENESPLSLQHKILHTHLIQEHFEITETTTDKIKYPEWAGISSVSHALQMWFGSPTINGDFDVSETKKLVSRRERELKIEKELLMTNTTSVQVCSYAIAQSNSTVKFTAVGSFTVDDVSGAQVRKILEGTGREFISVDGDTVFAKVRGEIGGKYVIRIVSFTGDIDKLTPCLSFMGKTVKEVKGIRSCG